MDIVMIGEVREKEVNKNNAANVVSHTIMPTLWTQSGLLAVEKGIIEMCGMPLSEERQFQTIKITDREEAITVIKEHGSFLRYLAENFKNEKEFVNLAMQENIYNLQYASNAIRSSPEMILKAINAKPELYRETVFNTCASESLKEEVGNNNIIYYLEKKILNDQLQEMVEMVHKNVNDKLNKIKI